MLCSYGDLYNLHFAPTCARFKRGKPNNTKVVPSSPRVQSFVPNPYQGPTSTDVVCHHHTLVTCFSSAHHRVATEQPVHPFSIRSLFYKAPSSYSVGASQYFRAHGRLGEHFRSLGGRNSFQRDIARRCHCSDIHILHWGTRRSLVATNIRTSKCRFFSYSHQLLRMSRRWQSSGTICYLTLCSISIQLYDVGR